MKTQHITGVEEQIPETKVRMNEMCVKNIVINHL